MKKNTLFMILLELQIIGNIRCLERWRKKMSSTLNVPKLFIKLHYGKFVKRFLDEKLLVAQKMLFVWVWVCILMGKFFFLLLKRVARLCSYYLCDVFCVLPFLWCLLRFLLLYCVCLMCYLLLFGALASATVATLCVALLYVYQLLFSVLSIFQLCIWLWQSNEMSFSCSTTTKSVRGVLWSDFECAAAYWRYTQISHITHQCKLKQ